MKLDLFNDSMELESAEIMELICSVFNVKEHEISDIHIMKKGMTNRSFTFTCKGNEYIIRIPGEGTDRLINRNNEASVYRVITEKHICDDIVYINAKNGYKITKFFSEARNCDPLNIDDVKKCISRLREFHKLKLSVSHEFDIFEQIEFYEALWDGKLSKYQNYVKVKEKIFSLRNYINKHCSEKVLAHIDAVPDNFIFIKGDNGKEEIRLIDWEYSGMQDPHVDIAMFCIYSSYNKYQIDEVISLYFTEGCTIENRIKIYCYIAVCGLLWSNWCEYKEMLGVEFGEYAIAQYKYAVEYYDIVQDELLKIESGI